MKNFVFAILLLFSISSVYSQDIYYVSADNGLYARQAPDRGSKAIAKLNYGTPVQITENTQLKLDVMDKGQKVSGQWVKIKANTNYENVEAYVFDGYLSSQALSPRSVVSFDNMKVAFHNMNVMEDKNRQRVRMKDSTFFYGDLGITPENKIISIKALEHYSKLEVYQAYRTSVTIMNEGPHCDLKDWLHYNSSWEPLERIDDNTFKSKSYSSQEASKFTEFSIEELKKTVEKDCGEQWLELINSTSNSNAAIGIDTIYFKVIMTSPSGKRSEKIIAFEIPMGC